MARIFLTNKGHIVPEIVEGTFKYNELHVDRYKILSFQKIRSKTKNFLKFDNGDFIASAGTIIYKENLGASALEMIYSNYEGDVNTIRNNSFGNYTLLIKKKGVLSIFVDENSIHDLFYTINASGCTIGTSLYHVLLTDSDETTFNKTKLIEFSAQYCLINGETFFDNTKKLQGNEIITIDLTTDIASVLNIEEQENQQEPNTFEEYLDHIVEQLDESVGILSKNFKKIGVSMTGGLDSRVLLSALLRNGVKPELYYGVGNTSITNTKSPDLHINQIFSERYNLDLTLMDWKHPVPLDSNWEELMTKYGFLSCTYGGANIFAELENGTSDFIDYGYFGEPFRNIDWMENKEASFTLEEFLDQFYLNKVVKPVLEDYASYKQQIYLNFESLCKQRSIDPGAISLEEFQILHNEYRKNADKVMLNLTNLFCHSISVLSQKKILGSTEKLPKKFKEKSNFMLHLLDNLYPDILNVEFFSHTKKWVFNREKFHLKRKDYVKIDRVVALVRKLNIKTKLLEKIYGFIKRGKVSEEIKKREELRDYFKNKIDDEDFEKINDLSFLVRYSQHNYIISKILKKVE